MLEYANEEYRDDKDVVFQAIKQNWITYQFASDRLKQDEELKQLALEDDSVTDKNEIIKMFKWTILSDRFIWSFLNIILLFSFIFNKY